MKTEIHVISICFLDTSNRACLKHSRFCRLLRFVNNFSEFHKFSLEQFLCTLYRSMDIVLFQSQKDCLNPFFLVWPCVLDVIVCSYYYTTLYSLSGFPEKP